MNQLQHIRSMAEMILKQVDELENKPADPVREQNLEKVQDTEENRVWHSGPPPHVGWWNASSATYVDRWNPTRNNVWRWWNGHAWSVPVYESNTISDVANRAEIALDSDYSSAVEWTDYWPENARVPRIDPGK